MPHYFYYQGKERPNIPKFIPLLDVYPEAKESAMIWHGCKISEDGKTIVTQSHNVHPSDPIGHLLDVWDQGILVDPRFESCAGHFGRYLNRSYENENAVDKPWLKPCAGGFRFFGNHLTLSHGFSMYTSDIALARELFVGLSKVYSQKEYNHGAKLNITGQWWQRYDPTDTHLYYSKLTGFVTVRTSEKALFDAFMNKKRTLGHPYSSREHWAAYCTEEAEYLGPRLEVDLGAVLRQKLDDPNEYFNKLLPVDHAPLKSRRVLMIGDTECT